MELEFIQRSLSPIEQMLLPRIELNSRSIGDRLPNDRGGRIACECASARHGAQCLLFRGSDLERVELKCAFLECRINHIVPSVQSRIAMQPSVPVFAATVSSFCTQTTTAVEDADSI